MALQSQSEGRRFTAVLLFLLAMMPLTWGMRQYTLRATDTDIEARKLAAIGRAFSDIQRDFDRQQLDLLTRARSLAAEQQLIVGLRASEPGQPLDERLVRLMATLKLSEREAVEVYNPTPQLVAWSGFSMPLDDGPSRQRFLDGALAGIAQDEGSRVALVVWWPVTDGLTVLGVVRFMRLLELEVPVENEYLRGYSQALIWSRKTRLPVQVLYDAPFDDEMPAGGEIRLLSGLDGSRLGRVFIDLPADEDLVDTIGRRHDHLLAFWVTMAAMWLAFGAWMWYRRAGDNTARTVLRFAVVAGVWTSVRYILILIDVPGRYQQEKAPLAPLFDPTHLASSAGFGLLKSTGDLLVTSLFALGIGLLCLHVAGSMRRLRFVASREDGIGLAFRSPFVGLFGLTVAATTAGATYVLGELARYVILDSTLDYFARTGLLPEDLVLTVFSSLLIVAMALTAAGVAVVWVASRLVARDGRAVAPTDVSAGVVIAAVLLVVFALVTGAGDALPWPAIIAQGAAIVAGYFVVVHRLRHGAAVLTLRNVIPSIFVLTAILYPLFYHGMEIQRQVRMVDAADSFEDGRDPRVLFGVEQVLLDARRNELLREHMLRTSRDARTARVVDSLATNLMRHSFLASLGSFETSMTIYDGSGSPVGRYYEVDPRRAAAALNQVETEDLAFLSNMYNESGKSEPLVEPITGEQQHDRFQYHGIVPVTAGEANRAIAWIVVRASPRTLLREATPFPRVLVPAGFYGNLYASLSVAVFREGTLVRSTGDDFGRYQLRPEIQSALATSSEVWLDETVRGKDYLAYYRVAYEVDPAFGIPVGAVIGVRIASISVFDHLYNLLRLTFGGLIIGLPIYLSGLIVRHRRGLLPAPQVRFRDKILNAFFGVGVITVAAMGVVGLNVVTGENEREIESWLRQHLERVERAVSLDAGGGEMAYRVLERTRIDSLAARVGLDLNIYRDSRLVASSRPQLVRDRLIDPRLPIKAYEALYLDGFKFAETTERVGKFTYVAGFRALPNEQGQPHYVMSIPTLPEQERIEEERARTVAYLFGALLLLVFVVMITASLLANALTRPVVRLREGIEAVARGRFSRVRPLDTRDEIGELVDSFNTMQDQLAESRRRLAQQERQLAWREMARQVAHEIKNPLTPMKLSVQYLRRSFEDNANKGERLFADQFDRITSSLTEQIDALARIANEFSSFARMPQRIEELLDLNAVIAEAATLMEAEAPFPVSLDLVDEALIVRADREEVRRIYINLIKNAIQSIPDGREGQITITTRREWDETPAGVALSTVSDNGSGIPEDLHDKIFVPNFSTKTSGTGLGLAIVRKSVEDLHGEIGFETAEDEGTSFWIRLPLEVDEPGGENPDAF